MLGKKLPDTPVLEVSRIALVFSSEIAITDYDRISRRKKQLRRVQLPLKNCFTTFLKDEAF